jgi:8-amino-7-oxononanoate synthase
MSLAQRWRTQLEALRGAGRYRQLAAAAGLDFCSNDYLGYARRPWPAADGVRSGAASRLLRGHVPLWDEVESRLARWHGAESALIFTSGYAANEGLLSTLIEPGDIVASDQHNHASIIDGLRLSKAERLVYRHNDVDELERMLLGATRRRRPQQALFIVTESLFGMDGDRAPLASLVELARRHDAQLIVDEAHATGCFGATGSGLVDELGLRAQVLATVHTGGKALGVPGAYVACSALVREVLINRCRHFIFTTALPPAVAAWWLDMLDGVAAEPLRGRLHEMARCFRDELGRAGVAAGGEDYIVPIVLGADDAAVAAARRLQTQGFDIRPIRPPSVAPGTARLRIAIHAVHASADLQRLASALRAP